MYFYFKIDLLFIFANKITRVMSYIYKIRTSVCMTISLVMMLFVTSCSNDDFFDLDDHYISDDYYMSELKALDSEQLDEMLNYLTSTYGISLMDFNSSSILPSLNKKVVRTKRGDPEGPADLVVSNTNNNGKVEVYLNSQLPAVTNSRFYSNSLWDAFFDYEHNGGSAWRGNDTIYFIANGTFIIKLISNGIQLKRLPTQIQGYYNTSTQSGEITN